jgi:hypothetical protein
MARATSVFLPRWPVDRLRRKTGDTAPLVETVGIGLARPVRDPKRLTRLLYDKIETIDPGLGIEIISLADTLAEPLEARQGTTSLIDTPEHDLSELSHDLANRVGARAIYRFTPVALMVRVRKLPRQAIAACSCLIAKRQPCIRMLVQQ